MLRLLLLFPCHPVISYSIIIIIVGVAPAASVTYTHTHVHGYAQQDSEQYGKSTYVRNATTDCCDYV